MTNLHTRLIIKLYSLLQPLLTKNQNMLIFFIHFLLYFYKQRSYKIKFCYTPITKNTTPKFEIKTNNARLLNQLTLIDNLTYFTGKQPHYNYFLNYIRPINNFFYTGGKFFFYTWSKGVVFLINIFFLKTSYFFLDLPY